MDSDSKKTANRNPIVCPLCDGDIPELEEKQKEYNRKLNNLQLCKQKGEKIDG